MSPSPSPSRAGVVALRVIRQLKRDRRTIGLIVFAPIVLMVLFGYALSGDMSGVALGLVDGGGHDAMRDHIESVKDFSILHLGSESDAEKLIDEGRLDGAVVLQPAGVRVLLDASSLQIAAAIQAAVQAAAAAESAAKKTAGPQQGAESAAEGAIVTRYIFGYDLEMMDTVG
ncbi:MAG TPA: ABC transporter permease, partial [Methanothrix sp.]|nr:ABC transporter permease [Methanothrix sp.]